MTAVADSPGVAIVNDPDLIGKAIAGRERTDRGSPVRCVPG
jgi:hypothetical protein